MRVEQDGISVHAIPGTRSVLFGFDVTENARQGLLGFALGKRDKNGSVHWQRGFKFFEETVPHPLPGERRSTRDHPIQGFQWGDYTAEPATTNTYVFQGVYGTPSALTYSQEMELQVSTSDPETEEHGVYFNRGAIPSQAFADRFGNIGPTEEEQDDPNNEKVKWLSRGLLEAFLGFIGQACGNQYELRVAAYEFHYKPIQEALKTAARTGAQVRISFDGGDQRRDGTIKLNSTSQKNLDTISALGLDQTPNLSLHPRTLFSKIPHNKFFVLLKNGQPVQVLTGSTNITPSGFLGQSNVGHIVRDPNIAKEYNAYWDEISQDPATRPFKKFNGARYPTPNGDLEIDTIRAVFSPRPKGMLEWYAEQLGRTSQTAMFTAAFGVSRPLAEKFAIDRDFLRFILMERRSRDEEIRELIRRDRDTRIAMGTGLNAAAIRMKMNGHKLDEWFRAEEHFRKRGHIFYIHTKILMLDVLSDDPVLFSGSANFSQPSVTGNDENMLLMRGPRFKGVAQVYVNEYMRLFNHLYFRTIAVALAFKKRGNPTRAAILSPDDTWSERAFRPDSYHFRKRELFK